MNNFLTCSEYIDWQHPTVLAKARALNIGLSQPHDIIYSCFTYVRDEIKHSWDYKIDHVTCKASDTLKFGTGFCYAKSHLLAALLRANGIPTGLCYQRLTFDDDKPPYVLHGLNAVYLDSFGWYRIDPRGNKPGIQAEFTPPMEKLAFPIKYRGEADLPEVWAEPLPVVVEALTRYTTIQQVVDHLPDVELVTLPN